MWAEFLEHSSNRPIRGSPNKIGRSCRGGPVASRGPPLDAEVYLGPIIGSYVDKLRLFAQAALGRRPTSSRKRPRCVRTSVMRRRVFPWPHVPVLMSVQAVGQVVLQLQAYGQQAGPYAHRDSTGQVHRYASERLVPRKMALVKQIVDRLRSCAGCAARRGVHVIGSAAKRGDRAGGYRCAGASAGIPEDACAVPSIRKWRTRKRTRRAS